MKIGILTFHFCDNFGAVLQCASLYKTIQDFGHEVDVIDYRPQPDRKISFFRGWGLASKNPFRNIRKHVIELSHGRAMMKRFEAFRNQTLSRSAECRTLDELSEVMAEYDAVVVGSDQVWNRSYGFVSLAYFLENSLGFKGRKVSYAACCGHKEMPQHEMSKIKKALCAFDHMAVRNQITYEWVNELTGLEPEVVCDPTLLCDFEICVSECKIPYKKYILVYVLGAPIQGGHEAALAEVRRQHGGLPIVVVATTSFRFQFYPYADHVVWDAGPNEWMHLIKNAAYFYTDSFHGVIFAMKYKTPFFGFYAQANRSHRLIDTAQRVGVSGAIASGLPDALERGCLSCRIDFDAANEKMNALVYSSKKFLKQAFSNEANG